jgi:hypothetical protein
MREVRSDEMRGKLDKRLEKKIEDKRIFREGKRSTFIR